MTNIVMPQEDRVTKAADCRKYLEEVLGAKAFKAMTDAARVPDIPNLTTFNDNLGYAASKEKLRKLQDAAAKAPFLRANSGRLSLDLGKYTATSVDAILHAIPVNGPEYDDLIMEVIAATMTQGNERYREQLYTTGRYIEKRADELDDEASKMLGQIMHLLTPMLLLSTEERYTGLAGTDRLVRHIKRRAEEVLDSDYGLFQTVLPLMLKYDNKCSAMDKAISALAGKTWEEVKQQALLKTCSRAYNGIKLPPSPASGGSTREYSYVATIADGKFYIKHHESAGGVTYNSMGYSDDEIITDVSMNVDAYMTALLG